MEENREQEIRARQMPAGNKLREKLIDLIGADRWIDGSYPAVAPVDAEEAGRLLKGFPGNVLVVGSGTSFSEQFNPGSDSIVLITRSLLKRFEFSRQDHVLVVSSGWLVSEVNLKLAHEGFIIPSLARFKTGTVGGRLASVSSRPVTGHDDGWIQALLGLEVVLPSGELLRMGGSCIKDVAGYDLKHVFTGSRGAAGVITSATFRCWNTSSIDWKPPANIPSPAGRFDATWRRLLDPMGRMHPGI